jgi:hypothetical protein
MEFFADQAMDGFGIGAGVPQRAAKTNAAVRVSEQFGRFAGVPARAFGKVRGHDKVRVQIDAEGQFGKAKRSFATGAAAAEIVRNVAGFEPRAVAGNLGARTDQPAALG